MPTQQPTPIPFPRSSLPGANPQEGSGRLINCYLEPLGEQAKGAIAPNVWRRSPGLSIFAQTTNSGYRGGMLVNDIDYDVWSNTAATVFSTGTVTTLGPFPGNGPISIAHNNA